MAQERGDEPGDPAPSEEKVWVTSRRAVLRAGALAGVAAAGGLTTVAATAAPPLRVRYVVADRRIAESLAFASVLEEQGAERLDVSDGLTRLWRARLLPHWENAEGPVAGLTSPAVWDCLSQQARDHFRKARLLGRHVVADGGDAPGLKAWPIHAAHYACAGLPRRERECVTFPVASIDAPGTLHVSWMIG
jgi:hypothetical protein